MVDFRYHLVSLVSVFLALAVGIILGAGPLQNSIGNTLSGQIDTLRESRDSLRDELSATQEQLAGSDSALDVAGGELLPNTLTGRNMYAAASFNTVQHNVELDLLANSFMRGPGEAPGCFGRWRTSPPRRRPPLETR